MSARPGVDRRNNRIAVSIFATALFMLGMSFAAVPLYKMFCQVTGFGGTPRIAESASSVMGKKTLGVRFDANISPELDWSFKPDVNAIQLRTGKTVTIFYKVTNNSSQTQTAMATFNVFPDQAGSYFNKISCFCFTDKTLGPGETMELPVVFYLDPALESDETMKDVAGVTLSYTFIAKKARKTAAALPQPANKTGL
ncbi:MAG: cytochrome c oxidase assembly protein [Beijerinckiaceae bacterium]|mgnify:CR=1 FL=1|jgi:cytochrome c oxidase assembly protein subunit 11|nr:cytochrome c oxidase assembly protein [Beijerinckiaceae bacterium]